MAHSDAVDDPISFEAVSSACTDSLPNGDACSLAWEKLENIYAMKSTTKKGELKAEFFATKLKAATSDPDTKMELIKAKLKLDRINCFCRTDSGFQVFTEAFLL